MFGAIQFGGLASGLDTAAIIEALLAVERNTINTLEGRKAEEQEKLSLVGTLEGLVKDLEKKADGLAGATGFFSHAVSLSQEGLFDVTVSGNAPAGTHEVTVNALATAARFHSSAFASDDLDLGTGTISFDYQGATHDVEITDAASSDLNDIADKINEEVGTIVTATVLNTGTETNPSYELVLNARETGSDNEIENLTVTGLGDQGTLSFTRLQAAEDAEVVFDGITVTRSSNVFSDLLQGYEFTLSQADPGTTVTISAELDTDATLDNLQEFVDAYNGVIDFINAQNEYTEEGGTGGELFGDFLLSRVGSTLYGSFFDVDLAEVQSDTTGYASLGLVGFDVASDGTLSVDRTQAAEKLAADPVAFENLLTGPTEYPSGSGESVNGAFGKLAYAIDELISAQTSSTGDPLEGLFEARKTSLDDQIDAYDGDIEDEERRLETLEATLVQRFSALEELLGGLQAQQSFLSSVV